MYTHCCHHIFPELNFSCQYPHNKNMNSYIDRKVKIYHIRQTINLFSLKKSVANFNVGEQVRLFTITIENNVHNIRKRNK